MSRKLLKKSLFPCKNLPQIVLIFSLLTGFLSTNISLNNPVKTYAGGPLSSSSSSVESSQGVSSSIESSQGVSSSSDSSQISSSSEASSQDNSSSSNSEYSSSSEVSSAGQLSSDTTYPEFEELKISSEFLEPLDTTLNHDKSKDRLNIVFYYTDYTGNLNDLKAEASKLILLKDVKNVNPSSYGVFNVEPFRSSINKFNFWFYKKAVPVSQDYQFEYLSRTTDSLGIDYITPVRLTYDYIGRSNADYADIQYNPDYSIKTYYNSPVRLYLNGFYGNGLVLAHEFGHSIFALADEYYESGRDLPVIKYPNCAPDKATATQWWGDLEGTVDPFFYEYRQALIDYYTTNSDSYEYLRYNDGVLEIASYDFVYDENNEGVVNISWKRVDDLNLVLDEEDFRVKFIDGLCFSMSENGAVRPTVTSAMLSSGAIYGSVNRRQMQRILDMFSGESEKIAKRKPDYLNPEIFDVFKLGEADCKIKITLEKKKLLTCTIKNGKPLISKTNTYKIGLVKYDETEQASATESGAQTCRLSEDGTIFVCDALDITNKPLNQQYSLLFFFEPGLNSIDPQPKYPTVLPIAQGVEWVFDFNLSIFPVTQETSQSSSNSSSTSSSPAKETKTAVPVTAAIISNNSTQTTTQPIPINDSTNNNSVTSKSSSLGNNSSQKKSSSTTSNPANEDTSSSEAIASNSTRSNNNLGNILLGIAVAAVLAIGGYLTYVKLSSNK